MSLDRRSFLFLGASAFADLALAGYNPLNGYSVRTDGMDCGKTLKVKQLEIDIGIGRAFTSPTRTSRFLTPPISSRRRTSGVWSDGRHSRRRCRPSMSLWRMQRIGICR